MRYYYFPVNKYYGKIRRMIPKRDTDSSLHGHFATDSSLHGQFATWTVRYMDSSLHGQFATWIEPCCKQGPIEILKILYMNVDYEFCVIFKHKLCSG